ncbi:MAG: aminotransferase class V-fold PLP-dependent enzyme [Acidobacteriota bacterium]
MKTSRRHWFRSISLAPLLAWLNRSTAFASITGRRGRGVYQELGIRPVLNFRGTHTVIGASKIWPELHEAMAEASRDYVDLNELQDRIGKRLARLVGSESAMVTTGAAGAITLGTCAALTGGDVTRVRRLPDLTGLKSEVLIQTVHRNAYDHAIRNAGVRLVEVAGKNELLAAISPRTALLYYLGGTTGDWAWETPVPLEECLELGRKAGFPVMVDAANMLPPWENIRKLAALKTDLICISGGKHLRGPQCSGILAGRQDLIAAARLNSNPHADSLGRGLKAGREEMVGVWLAAEKYAQLDFVDLERQSARQADYLSQQLRKIPGLAVEPLPHDRTRKVYRVSVQWDESAVGINTRECEKQLLEGTPRIAVLRHEGQGITFTVFMNDPGDEREAARRMREIFARRGPGRA